MMLVAGLLLMTICLLMDHMIIDKIIYKIFDRSDRTSMPAAPVNMDDDVLTEKERVRKLKEGNLVLQGLSKSYKSNLAVNQLYLGVDNGECFGLLGINGAGKTSTFKMMTGDENISSGDVWVAGSSMKNSMLKAQKGLGYCPQFDALIFEISGRESLKIFSLIRGIPMNEIDGIVLRLATELGFHMHLDKKVKAYSGGNKRKLSTALVS